MVKKINEILKEVLGKYKLSDAEISSIEKPLRKFSGILKNKIKKSRLKAEIFIGGSFAKNTMIKKEQNEADIFIRFDKKYDNISSLAENLLKNFGKGKKIHGSRDYFQIRKGKSLFFEIIPVIKIKRPEDARNITDLSFFHVNYVKKRFPKKISDEIILAKAFCHASGCYGAESYIHGFSGYSLELLVYHYGSFLKFTKAMAKISAKDKTVIDIEKKFKNKHEVLMDINSAKLQSPIILVDPTYKQRNVLAALSDETLKKFQKYCKGFLKSPNIRFFEKREIDFEKLEENARKRNFDFILIKAKTDKQPGDIAGSKLMKFYNHLSSEIEGHFSIKASEFSYNKGDSAICLFSVKPRKDIINAGPMISDRKNLARFKKKHKKTFTKSGRVYSKEKADAKIKKFVSDWKGKNKKRLKEMHVTGLEIV